MTLSEEVKQAMESSAQQAPLDPAQVEKEMLEEAKKATDDPEEVASMLFTLYLPRYFSLVEGLSSNAMRRMLKALVEYPLNDKNYMHSSPKEKEAFNIGLRLLDAKYVMLFSTYSGGLEELHRVANEIETTSEDEVSQTENVLDVSETQNEGENNG